MWRLVHQISIGICIVAIATCVYRLTVLGHSGVLCKAPLITGEIAKGLVGHTGACWEYWANRYQTLIGVLAAVGAAWFTWIAAQQNIRRMDNSLEISRRQLAAAAIEQLASRQEMLNRLEIALIMSREALHKIKLESIPGSVIEMRNRLSNYNPQHDFQDYTGKIRGAEIVQLEHDIRSILINSRNNDASVDDIISKATLKLSCRQAISSYLQRAQDARVASSEVCDIIPTAGQVLTGGKEDHKLRQAVLTAIQALSVARTDECLNLVREDALNVVALVDTSIDDLGSKHLTRTADRREKI